MSGVISLHANKEWIAAGWAYDAVVSGVADILQPDRPDLAFELRSRLSGAGLMYLDLQTKTVDDMNQIANAVSELLRRTKASGPTTFAAPEFFPGYLQGIERLRLVLKDAIEDRK